jgi:hypothetical protein
MTQDPSEELNNDTGNSCCKYNKCLTNCIQVGMSIKKQDSRRAHKFCKGKNEALKILKTSLKKLRLNEI